MKENGAIRIIAIMNIALIVTLYCSGFPIFPEEGPLYTTNKGVCYREYFGIPIAYIWNYREDIEIAQNRTLYIRTSEFIPIFFLCDWLIFTTIFLIILTVIEHRSKKENGDIT